MKMHYLMQAIFAIMGLISILGSIFNWEWFFGAQNMQTVVSYLGRKGARILYAIIGVLLITLAAYFFTEVQKVS